MSQLVSSSSSLPLAIHGLQARIVEETPWLHVVGVHSQPQWFVQCKDTHNHNIHVAFSSEAEWRLYVHLLGGSKGEMQ